MAAALARSRSLSLALSLSRSLSRSLSLSLSRSLSLALSLALLLTTSVSHDVISCLESPCNAIKGNFSYLEPHSVAHSVAHSASTGSPTAGALHPVQLESAERDRSVCLAPEKREGIKQGNRLKQTCA